MKLDITKLPVLPGVIVFLLVAIGAAFTGAFLATDDDQDGTSDGGNAAPTAAPTGDQSPPPDGDSFTVSMGDNFFDPNQYTVTGGATVTFGITNNGAAIHNMRIAGPDGEYNTDDDTVSEPDLFMAGDTGTLVWDVPGSPGEIIFRCDFHPTEMTGDITVE